MSGYMKGDLKKIQCPTPTIPQHSPHQWTAPNYGPTAPKIVHLTDDSPEQNPYEYRNSRKIVGNVLYYSRAVEPTMIVTLNKISAKQ